MKEGDTIKLNEDAFKNLFLTEFSGNYHEAARQIGANESQIHRIINKRQGAGMLFLERLMTWCTHHGKDYREYIFFPDPLTVVNDTPVPTQESRRTTA